MLHSTYISPYYLVASFVSLFSLLVLLSFPPRSLFVPKTSMALSNILDAIEHYVRQTSWRFMGLRHLPFTKNLPKLGRWFVIWFLLLCVLGYFVFEFLTPILGEKFIESRRYVPSRLPAGLSLVDTVESTLPVIAESVYHIMIHHEH